jgi:hypothetical protein
MSMIRIPPQILQRVRDDLQRNPYGESYTLPLGHIACSRRVAMLGAGETWCMHRFTPRSGGFWLAMGLWTYPIRGLCTLNVESGGIPQFYRDTDARYFCSDEGVRTQSLPPYSCHDPCDVRFKREGAEPCELDFLLVVYPCDPWEVVR